MRVSSTAIRQLVALATSGAPVKLRFRGAQASTNGEVITLPEVSIPLIEAKMPGYAWHEAFHIRYTDFRETARRKVAPLEKMLTNIIEDGRIERLARQEYPGTYRTLNRLIESILATEDSTLFHAPNKEATPPNVLLGFVLNWTRAEINGYTAIKHMEKWREAALSAFGSELVAEIEVILDQTRSVETTAEAYEAARRIAEVLAKEANRPNDKGSDNEPLESGDSESDASNDSEAGERSSRDDDSESGSGQSRHNEEGRGKGDESGDADSGEAEGSQKNGDPDQSADDAGTLPQNAADEALSASEDNLDETDLGDISREAINRCSEDANDTEGGRGAGNGPEWADVVVEAGGQSKCLDADTRGAASALGTRIRGILQGETLVRNVGDRRRGRRLNLRRGYRIVTGDPRIWRTKDRRIDTCGNVHLILDTSGSMDKQVEELRRFGYATVKAIDSVEGVTVSASTLPIRGEIKLLKLPTERVAQVGRRFDGIPAEGGTPLAKSIEAVRDLILAGDVENRLLLIFTDGSPACVQKVKEQVESLEQQGVGCCAVILGDSQNRLEEMMPCARVDVLAKLPAAASRLVAEALRRKIAARRVA